MPKTTINTSIGHSAGAPSSLNTTAHGMTKAISKSNRINSIATR